jgi:hypothetical protein
MFGWENLVGEVARAYRTLSPEERSRCGIYCMDYHQAGAVDFLGESYGLPAASSGHNNYWLWGPHGSWDGGIVITRDPRQLSDLFEGVSPQGFIQDTTGYVQPSENNLSVCVVRGLKIPTDSVWAQVKHYE